MRSGDYIIRQTDLTLEQSELCARVNFLIIGAQKAGTSWLSDAIGRHKHAFVPPSKELHFFNMRRHYDAGFDRFLTGFDGLDNAYAVGEATPNYFWNAPGEVEEERYAPILQFDIAPRVQALFPDAVFLLCLRDPVDRAISSFVHQATRGRVSPFKSLRDQMHLQGIRSMGEYHHHLKHWRAVFPPEQFELLIYEEDIAPDEKKLATINRVFRRLGIEEIADDALLYQTSNAREAPLLAYIRSLLNAEAPSTDWGSTPSRRERLVQGLNRRAPAWLHTRAAINVTEEDRAALAAHYAPHNAILQDMINRELPWQS